MLDLAYPWLLLALPLPLVLLFVLPAYRESRKALRVPFLERLESASGGKAAAGSAIRRRTSLQRYVLQPLCWILVVLALARPQWIGEPQSKIVPSRDLLLAVDLSGSMETEDFKNADGETVDRLTAVKEVVDEFIAAREGDRVGLIVFGSAAFVQTTFTEDLEAVRSLLAETRVRMAGPKTVIGDAIGLSLNMFRKSDLEDRVLILLTDGNDTESLVPPANAARLAADDNVTIHTIAVGDPAAAGEAAIDEKSLQDIAEVTNGVFFRAEDRDELAGIYERIDAMETRENEVVTHQPTSDLFHWPIGAVVVLVLVYHVVCGLRSIVARGTEGTEGTEESDGAKRPAGTRSGVAALLLISFVLFSILTTP